MATPIDLSILVCGVHTRYDTFLPKIQRQLFEQLEALSAFDQERVEIIVLTDNKKMMLGEKRNIMVDMAQGRYVVFVDDDDAVADEYVQALLDATASGADAIVFHAAVSLNGAEPKICRYSKDYGRDRNTADEYLRIPNHICCVRREVSLKSSFPSIPKGEDSAYAKLLLPHLQTEHKIDRVLYCYNYDDDVTETQERVNKRVRVRNLPPVADVVFLSNGAKARQRNMTQAAINSAIAGANSLPVNCIVVEQQPGVTYRNATTIRPSSPDFHYNRSANEGVRAGTADWVVIANNDLIFENGWLHNLLAPRHPVVSPFNPGDRRQIDVEDLETGYQNGRHFSGWCFMVQRRLWLDWGGFDECVSFWCSDDVVVEQCRASGVAPMIVRDAVVRHLGSKTLSTLSSAHKEELTWKQVLIFERKYGIEKFADDPRYQQWKARQP